MDYSKWSRDALMLAISSANDKLDDEMMEETKNNTKIQYYQDKLNSLTLALNALDTQTSNSTPSSGQTWTPIMKEMQLAIQNHVPKFTSGVDVYTFISALELYYNLYVATNQGPGMEAMFIRLATSQMSVEYANAMSKQTPIIATFDQMKTYLKLHHASKMSVFQILDQVWVMEKMQSESIRDYSHRIEDKAIEAEAIIIAKFEEKAKSSGKAETFSIRDYTKLITGEILLQRLKLESPTIYNQMCGALDDVWSAVEISSKAMSYQERMVKEDEPNQASAPSTFIGKSDKDSQRKFNSDNSSQQLCYKFITHDCNGCNRIHDQELKQLMQSRVAKIKNGQKEKKKKNKSVATKSNQDDKLDSNAHIVTVPGQVFQN